MRNEMINIIIPHKENRFVAQHNICSAAACSVYCSSLLKWVTLILGSFLMLLVNVPFRFKSDLDPEMPSYSCTFSIICSCTSVECQLNILELRLWRYCVLRVYNCSLSLKAGLSINWCKCLWKASVSTNAKLLAPCHCSLYVSHCYFFSPSTESLSST